MSPIASHQATGDLTASEHSATHGTGQRGATPLLHSEEQDDSVATKQSDIKIQTADDILSILDDCAKTYDFPMLDNAYIYPADVRMTLYHDPLRWALVIERLGFSQRAGSLDGTISVGVFYFGNCIKKKSPDDFVANEAYHASIGDHPYDDSHDVFPISEAPSGAWLADDWMSVPPDAREIRIRNKVVAIPRDVNSYEKHGVSLSRPTQIRAYELLRFLAPEYRMQMLATEEELRKLIPSDLPMIMQLNDWRHPDLADDEMPSQTSSFRMIAEVLHSGDITRYRTTEKPNTHWSHWPRGGSSKL